MNDLKEFVCNPWEAGYNIGEVIPPFIKHKRIDVPPESDLDNSLFLMEKINHIRKHSPNDIFRMPYIYVMKVADIIKVSGDFLEKYFCGTMEKLNPSLELGDRNINGINTEFKVSIIWGDKRLALFRRFKMWQKVDEYRLIILDKTNHYRPYIYILSPNQLNKELKLLNACDHELTKSANELNKRRKKSICLLCSNNNGDFVRWNKLYRREDLEEQYIEKINKSL